MTRDIIDINDSTILVETANSNEAFNKTDFLMFDYDGFLERFKLPG